MPSTAFYLLSHQCYSNQGGIQNIYSTLNQITFTLHYKTCSHILKNDFIAHTHNWTPRSWLLCGCKKYLPFEKYNNWHWFIPQVCHQCAKLQTCLDFLSTSYCVSRKNILKEWNLLTMRKLTFIFIIKLLNSFVQNIHSS